MEEGEDDELPEYTERISDEGIDMPDNVLPVYVSNLEPSWSFSHLGSMGAPHSQMTAVPPSSLNGEGNDFYNQDEEDLFAADDNTSMRAEGGDGSSVDMSDRDDDSFLDGPAVSATSEERERREHAPPPPLPPPFVDSGEAGDNPVTEIRVDDADEEQ